MVSNAEITHGPKIIPLWSEPDGWPLQAAPGRSRGLQSLKIGRIIAVREVARRPLVRRGFASRSAIALYYRGDGSELYLCPTNRRLSDKGTRPAGLKYRIVVDSGKCSCDSEQVLESVPPAGWSGLPLPVRR